MKKFILKLVRSNRFLERIFQKLFNKFQGDGIELSGTDVRNNEIVLRGENNKIISKSKNLLRNNIIRIYGASNVVDIKDNVIMTGNGQQDVYINGDNNSIIIDKNCRLTDVHFFIAGNNNKITISENYSGIAVEFHIERDNNEIFIGKGTTMHGRGAKAVHFAVDEGSKIIVGEDCMFANDIQIRSTDSHSIIDLAGKRLNPAQDIKIGNHCWIGLRSMILKGTEIANNTMIAGGSICTKKYTEQNAILAGNPAKVVKREVNWDRKFL